MLIFLGFSWVLLGFLFFIFFLVFLVCLGFSWFFEKLRKAKKNRLSNFLLKAPRPSPPPPQIRAKLCTESGGGPPPPPRKCAKSS